MRSYLLVFLFCLALNSVAETYSPRSYLKKQNARDVSSERVYNGLIYPSPSFEFGRNLSASGNLLAVAAPGARRARRPYATSPKSGPVFNGIPEIDIFEKVNSDWVFMTSLRPEDTGLLRNLHPVRGVTGFGGRDLTLSLSGNTLATTLGWSDVTKKFKQGIVVFELTPARSWVFKQFIELPSGVPDQKNCKASNALYHPRLKLNDNFLAVVDAPGKQAVHIFTKNASGRFGRAPTTLFAHGLRNSPRCVPDFGFSLDSFQNTFVFGSTGQGAYIAELRNNRWALTKRLFPRNLPLPVNPSIRSANGFFGWQVAASPELILVSSPNDPLFTNGIHPDVPSSAPSMGGAVSAVFGWTRQGADWVQSFYVKPPFLSGSPFASRLGTFPMSIQDEKVAIGAWGEMRSGQGAVIYEFKNGALSFTGLALQPASSHPFKTWGAFLDPQAFGTQLQFVGDSLVLSYPGDLSSDQTIRNDGTYGLDNSVFGRGSVFVFDEVDFDKSLSVVSQEAGNLNRQIELRVAPVSPSAPSFVQPK